MTLHIEDYALIGDCQTAALVGRDGSIDWLCLPRFDSGACFAALLGKPENGRWLMAPKADCRARRRRYVGDTLVLETEFETAEGVATVTDFMPLRDGHLNLFRIVEGKSGKVTINSELIVRFDYGSIVPWVNRVEEGLAFIAGPHALLLRTPVPTQGRDLTTVAEFTVEAGDRVPFCLTWHYSHEKPPAALDASEALVSTLDWWRDWSARCSYDGLWADRVVRSLITLKALTYLPTGGIAAAPTTSLPEHIGGVRNWDYRYCWLRDATFTLYALLTAGYTDEARSWRDWLVRAVAGDVSKIQIMYGIAGERRLTEYEIPWLPGYEDSRPVRIGNAASEQFQLDVYGEVIDAMFQSRKAGLQEMEAGWNLERNLLEFLEHAWEHPDEGLWEVRGPRQHFTHSKVMAWVAFDRAVHSVEQFNLDGPVERWRTVRDRIHETVCREAFDAKRNTFVQAFGSKLLDAATLMIPLVGFLPANDPRVRGTVAAVEKHLLKDGFVLRYDSSATEDGLPPGEGAFLPCTFWLADNYSLQGRADDARELVERLMALCNDLGLLSEEYSPEAKRMLGNFPQAFTHVGLVNSAMNLRQPDRCPASRRSDHCRVDQGDGDKARPARERTQNR